ncbi:MAG TPA: glycerol-3-phosphate dehydrogenase/oxidase [Rhizomicrobium sp.]|nr:glycerol-3-phosphate dehydrogenase/oxidase [Rhizomicrobium sp.]
MQRALSRLSSETFDVLIIGGGATGCFTARDAAMRGLKVALIEARDFASATSAHNSKLAHGGLRYLRNFEISLVRESLRERLGLMRMAPHLVRPLPFLLPLYRAGLTERLKLSAGLTLYDLLSFDRNRLEDPSQYLPGHRWIGAKSALAREPVLAGAGFEGAFEYHDAQMYAPERIALENLIDADSHGAAIANYVAAGKLLLRNGKVEGCIAQDMTTGAGFDIRARTVLVAAGPWADLFLEQATGAAAAHKLIRSKGIHLLVPQVSRAALTIEAGNGHLFALPWRGHTLLATTDTPFTGDPAKLAVSESDIEDFLATFRKYLPHAGLARDRVEFFYAGLRPLVSDGSPKKDEKNSYNVSRRSELVDHGKEGALDGLFSALGGKWTTSRALAQTITDALVAKLGRKTQACATATTPLPGGRFDRFEEMVRGYQKTWPGISSLRHLAHMLGARLPEALRGARLTDLATLGPSGDTPAQVAFALREEMALTLEDMVMRRTGIGQFGRPDAGVLEKVAAVMAAQLGWSEEKIAREIASLDPIYRTAP